MKKTLFLAVVFYSSLYCICLSAQITIHSSNMPEVNYEMFVSQQLIVGNMLPGYQTGGANKVWDFSTIQALQQEKETYISSTSSEIQFLCIAIFNNPLDPSHNASFAKKGMDIASPIPEMQISNVYEFYKNTNAAYTLVGRSATINNAPFCLRNNPTDTLFVFPLEFNTSYTSNSSFNITVPTVGYYEQSVKRTAIVDGWGSIVTPYNTFEALRIKMNLQFVDSLYYEQSGFGFKFPRTETHYIWVSNTLRIPVFRIEEKGPMGGGTIAFWTDNQLNNIEESNLSHKEISLYPQPVSDILYIKSENLPQEVKIIDLQGKLIKTIRQEDGINEIDIRFLSNGMYILLFDNTPIPHQLSVVR